MSLEVSSHEVFKDASNAVFSVDELKRAELMAANGVLLTVNFGAPNIFVTLWF
jgi:hypothetical protein